MRGRGRGREAQQARPPSLLSPKTRPPNGFFIPSPLPPLPDAALKIRAMAALAPVAYQGNARGLASFVAPFINEIDVSAGPLGLVFFLLVCLFIYLIIYYFSFVIPFGFVWFPIVCLLFLTAPSGEQLENYFARF